MISLVPWVSWGLTSLVWSWRSVMSPSGQQEVSSVSSSVSRAEKIKCSLQTTEVIVYVPRGHFNQTCRDVFIPWLSWLEMFLTRSLVVWMFLTKPFQWFWRQQWWLFACKVRLQPMNLGVLTRPLNISCCVWCFWRWIWTSAAAIVFWQNWYFWEKVWTSAANL